MDELVRQELPLLEYDPSPGVIEPGRLVEQGSLPERLVMCFFSEQIAALVETGAAREIALFGSEVGPNPVYAVETDGLEIGLVQPGVGAPFGAAVLDEAIASGVRKVIVCGGGGVLDREIAVGHLLVLEDAVRDEGTSYHYLPPSRRAAAHPDAVAALVSVLEGHSVPYLRATTWTTDAFYRETPAKVRLRRAEGCLCVEMEASALFSVAQFRGIVLGQLLYAGDDVSGLDWDSRGWQGRHDARAHVLQMALEACCRL